LYRSLDEVERVRLHESVGNALEALYEHQPGATAANAPQLAWHFLEAGITEKAIRYLTQAGERAVQLSAYTEALKHLTEGVSQLTNLPDSPRRAQLELPLQLALGMAWIGHRSYGTSAEDAYARARELCEQMGENSPLSRVLSELSVFSFMRGEHGNARELGESALSLARRTGDPLLVAIAHWCSGFILLTLGEYVPARDHLGQVISFYEPQQHHRAFVSLRGSDVGVSAMAHDACCAWCLGYPEAAWKRSQQALEMAKALDHTLSYADVLCFGGCVLSKMRRDAQALKDNATELMRLCQGMDFTSFWATGTCYLGEALAQLGQVQPGIAHIREGLSVRQSMGQKCYLSGIQGALAEALAKAGQPDEALATLAEALALVEVTGERHWEAELCRIRAELLLTRGALAEAEDSLRKAIEVARRQCARSWELRAATSLARLWQKQGRTHEARELLAPIYGWFTEGLDTRDLSEARALLGELT
jgi:predicted ATPase